MLRFKVVFMIWRFAEDKKLLFKAYNWHISVNSLCSVISNSDFTKFIVNMMCSAYIIVLRT